MDEFYDVNDFCLSEYWFYIPERLLMKVCDESDCDTEV